MAEVVVHRSVPPGQVEALLAPRDDFVAERATGDRSFELAEGPFRSWHREVEVGAAGPDGRVAVVERVRFRLAVPAWSVLFTPFVRWSVRRGRPARMPWWAPPDRLDARASTVLALLCSLSLVTGYLGTLLTQTNTFFREDFGVTEGAIGWLLGVVRVGALLAFVVVALADRRGRRRVLVAAALLGCAWTAAGALAPGLVWLGATQTVARAFSATVAIVAAIVAAEETPARSRAFAVSVLVMSAALGVGVAVMLLPVAGLADGTWRVLFALPLVALLPIVAIGRRLPESQRFRRLPAPAPAPPGRSPAGPPPAAATAPRSRRARTWARWRPHARRLALLALSGLCLELFLAPSTGFLNEYLRTDRSFSPAEISLFTLLTNTPGGLGIVVGGRLADVWGRRLVGAVGLGLGTACTVGLYLADGWSLWLWSLVGTIAGAAAIPALGVYGPELFPTAIRGQANGAVNLARVGGQAVGLVVAGALAVRLASGLSGAMAVLALGPVVVVLLVLVAFPETRGRELEDLNPEDAPLGRELLEMEGLDPDVLPGAGWPRPDPPAPDR